MSDPMEDLLGFLNEPKQIGDNMGKLDFLEDQEEMDSMEELSILVVALIGKRKSIDMLEEQLKNEKEMEKKLSQEEIPSVLLEKGVTSITLESGEKVTIIEDIFITVPKEDRAKRSIVLKWLIKIGGENLIKKEMKIEEPEEHIIQYLRKNKIPYVNSQTVHAGSLKAFLKGKLGITKGSLQEIEVGEVPKEANLFVFNKTKIK